MESLTGTHPDTMAARKTTAKKTARTRPPKRLSKEQIAQRWQRAIDKCANRREATDKGISFAALADATNVSRQRVYNQLVGPAPISYELYEALAKHIKLPAQPPKALPQPRTYEQLKERIRDNQRQIQAKVETGEYVRVPAILLTEPAHIDGWAKLIEHYGSHSKALRALIEANA